MDPFCLFLASNVLALFSSCGDSQDSFHGEGGEGEGFGALPPGPPTGASVLQSAALASPGSISRRNVLAAGAHQAFSRRLDGTATEADFAVTRAARPGIYSSQSGPISPAWSKSPWPGDPDVALDFDSISDRVVADMGL